MKLLTLLGLWHEWRAAVWESRFENPPLSEAVSDYARQRWCRACEVMREYHQRRYEHIKTYCAPRIYVTYFDPKEEPRNAP